MNPELKPSIESIILTGEIWIRCFYQRGPFEEVQIEIPPPHPFYEPGIYGFINKRDVRTSKCESITGKDLEGRQEGFVRGKVSRWGGENVHLFISGDLSHSPPITMPLKLLLESGIALPDATNE